MSDARLRELFAALNEDVPAADFTARVLRRIEHTERIRYLVLAGAAALGLAFAAGPLLDLFAFTMRELLDLIMTLMEADWTVANATPAAAVLLLALVPGLVRWLER